jgi:hypothetical protein
LPIDSAVELSSATGSKRLRLRKNRRLWKVASFPTSDGFVKS